MKLINRVRGVHEFDLFSKLLLPFEIRFLLCKNRKVYNLALDGGGHLPLYFGSVLLSSSTLI